MARATYVLRNGQLVEKHLAAPLHEAHGAGPSVISDTMAPIRSMADGKMYDSKSTYTRSVKAAGCEIVGNDRLTHTPTPLPSVGHDISRAIDELRSR